MSETCRVGHSLYGSCELAFNHLGPHARIPGGSTEANQWTHSDCPCCLEADLDLTAIEARANAATPGPWMVDYTGDRIESGARDLIGHTALIAESDMDFIVHARTDIPALVAELRRTRMRFEMLANLLDKAARACRVEHPQRAADLVAADEIRNILDRPREYPYPG